MFMGIPVLAIAIGIVLFAAFMAFICYADAA